MINDMMQLREEGAFEILRRIELSAYSMLEEKHTLIVASGRPRRAASSQRFGRDT